MKTVTVNEVVATTLTGKANGQNFKRKFENIDDVFSFLKYTIDLGVKWEKAFAYPTANENK